MLELSKNSNLIENDPYRYQLQEVGEPSLFREIYPYDEVPKTVFNHRRVDFAMPAEIYITDTSFRDGQQSMAPYSVEQMVSLFELLHRLSGPKGIIRQTEFFVYSDKDRKAIERCMAKGYEFPEITSWIRATKQDFELAKSIGIKETGILVSCSDYHIFKKLKMDRKQALEHYLAVVAEAFEAGVRPRCHLEDITRADFYGFVVPFVNALMDMSAQAGIPIKIRACDTLGYGVPYPGVALPRSVPGIIYGLRHYSGVPSSQIEWHGHNDFHKAVINATTAWLYGAAAVNCSMLGIGERTGNVPIEAMVFEYASLRGTTDGMDTTVITEIAEFFEREMGYRIPSMTPFVGRHFNLTRAGVHADGLMKDEEIYNIFDTDRLLNRPVRVALSNTSGLAGVAFWINGYYGLTGADKVDKQTGAVTKIKEEIDRDYDQGRQTLYSDEELEVLVARYAPAIAARLAKR
ncbi:MAG: 2-isopropylmalate synthase [Oscillospiraceae bacterium]|nr:2-isopropylmalate synthase [Oscillospiraceae bacterium]